MLVAIGAASGLPLSCEVMNYEAPFGVGYLVAQLTNVAAEPENERGRRPRPGSTRCRDLHWRGRSAPRDGAAIRAPCGACPVLCL